MGYFFTQKQNYSKKVISAPFQRNMNFHMFRYELSVKNVFDARCGFFFISHENEVLILSGLSGPLLSGFVFSHL